MSIQSIVKVDRYDQALLDDAVERHFQVLEVESELRPGMKVLLKPNLITAKNPDTAATTHPKMIRAVANWLLKRGIDSITIADSPGGPYMAANLRTVYSISGVNALSDVATLSFDMGFRPLEVQTEHAAHRFNIINPALDADYIINLPKLKTHSMMGVTAGVKNLFGLIPGLQKAEMHYRFQDQDSFAGMLIAIARAVTPEVTLIDAIDAMEGNGPTGGNVRHMGVTLAARDLFSQDEFACRLMGIDPEKIAQMRVARRLGLIVEMERVGDEISPASPAFMLPDSMKLDFSGSVPAAIAAPFRRLASALLRPYPFVDEAKCIGCGECARSCPAKVIQIKDKKARIERKKCISCFCCQELCPAKAIDARRRLAR